MSEPASDGSGSKSGVLWTLRWPFRVMAAVLERLLLWMATRANAQQFEPGERMLAHGAETGSLGHLWLASNRALYIEAKGSPANRRLGYAIGKRILYSQILTIAEERQGSMLLRTVRFVSASGEEMVSGMFPWTGHLRLTTAIQDQLTTPRPPGTS
jgi:hypothetical protein